MPTYPYVSGQAAIKKTLDQLRRAVPPKVDSAYLKRFNIAPANETYVINILRFLGLVDEEGGTRDDSTGFLFLDDEGFKSGLDEVIRQAYKPLFDDMREDAWEADLDALMRWVRAVDKTSETVGRRQASTFKSLAALAGHGEEIVLRASAPKRTPKPRAEVPKTQATKPEPKSVVLEEDSADKKNEPTLRPPADSPGQAAPVGLTVRVEVNLPAGADAETYDAIFASIRKNLIQ